LPSTYLRAAQEALIEGRKKIAAEALEMAQVRMLDWSGSPAQAQKPPTDPGSEQIALASQALLADERALALSLIGEALASQDVP
jgi:hypothetical protein